jgi:proteasome accessory factor A
MVRPMFGVESEYAIAGLGGKEPMRRDDLVNRFVRVAKRRLPHLPDMGSSAGMFLENGARYYIDCGLHPEMTTPECTTPWELARYIKAGERILEGLVQEVQAESGPATEVMCFRCNVDYSGSGSTWGCHESYLHRADPASLPEQLIPHLVTRGIYTGAGGFNPLVNWPEFAVAPRLLHIQHPISGDSTGNRGIFHTKNESLSGDGYNRLHILCGESLCSETAIVLKTGATALVAAMAEQGLRPGAGLRLESPIEALHVVALDPDCQRKLRLAGGGETTAIEVQRRLLHLAESHRDVLPAWTDAICALWRLTLDQLEGGPDSVSTVLDWAIKRKLFHHRAELRGIPMERFALLISVVRRLNVALANIGVKSRGVRLSALLANDSPIPEEMAHCGSLLEAQGLSWDDFDRFLALRDELYQIDTRFSQIGPRGIFTEMDRRGVLDHRVPAIDDVEAAMRQPPEVGRAKLRGEVVRRLSGQVPAGSSWMSVAGPDGRTLDLSDPFASTEVWADPPPPDEDDGPELPLVGPYDDAGHLQQMLDAMRRRYARSRSRAEGSPAPTEGPNR